MGIKFRYYLCGIIYASFFAPEKLIGILTQFLARWRNFSLHRATTERVQCGRKKPGFLVGLSVGLVVLVSIFVLHSRTDSSKHTSAYAYAKEQCSKLLTREILDESLTLGTRFLLNNQKTAGNFTYEYDWINRSYTQGDNQVRQAGAAWGLALIYHDKPDPKVATAIEKALAFFERHSRTAKEGYRYIAYPGQRWGSLGTVALVALSHIDYLRAAADVLSKEKRARYQKHTKQYLDFIAFAQTAGGRFHRSYDLENGQPYGSPSSYFDGESLLALTKAAKYLGRDDLKPLVFSAADAGYDKNVVETRRKDPDSKVTKGYYQWSSLSYFELATSGWPNTEKYGDWLIELADWMIDTHRTLERTRNTAYAYEGIIPAYQMAVIRGDADHAKKFGCTIEKGLEKLTSWQVGSSVANGFISKYPTNDPLAVGGVQNHRKEAPLRIDVTQHQMHAVILARRHYFTKKDQS